MSYLLQYATRTRAPTRRRRRGAARVDERTLLNRPGYYAGAYVRVYVEDTSARRARRGRFCKRPPEPRVRLQIADCTNAINLEFALTTPGERENSLFKINTLIAALHRFRDGLDAEADLYEERELGRHVTRKEV
jgi:hypothetical protein